MIWSNFPPQIHNLGGDGWQFGSVPRRPFNVPDVDDRKAVADWLSATVPGDVRADLLALGHIPDPFWGDGYRASLWVEDWDWWYRRPLDIYIEPGQRAFLIFDGIDYLSAVFVNERELGRHEGMFGRQIYEITGLLASSGSGLAVRLWGSGALPRRRLSRAERAWAWLVDRIDPSGVGAFPDRMATLKCQMSFGWDFAPPIRTIGIWDDVWLVVTGGVFIEDVWVKPQAPDPTRPARLVIQASVDSDQARPARAQVQMSPVNFDGSNLGPTYLDLDLPAGHSVQTWTMELPNAQAWTPWDRGFPHLYELKLSLQSVIPDSQALDARVTRFGIRHITLEDWTFTVNGQREFIRGINWVPADSLPSRLWREDYAQLLKMARAAGANLVRVWGGGLREKRAFYDLCDELGLLVWQEFPFACSFMGYFPRDADWLGLAERECAAIVQATRNHPCLALWCGGNEFSPRRNRALVDRLIRVVQVQDGTRPFLPASPSAGDAHNWDVWHGKYPICKYRHERARFMSEFGLQAAPALETLRACLPQAELWPPGTGWEAHKAELAKLWRYASTTLVSRANGGITPSLEEFIAASQQAQALGLQVAIEHMRRRKGETGGVCVWQFNEPWPAISWAVVDYWRRPKAAYQRLKVLYNPVLVGLTFPLADYQPGDLWEAEIWAINDSLEALEDCWLMIQLDGVTIYEATVTLPPDDVQGIGKLRRRFQAQPAEVQLTLRRDEQVIARNSYDLTYHDTTMPTWGERLARWLANILLR